MGWLAAAPIWAAEAPTNAPVFPAPGTALLIATRGEVQILRAGARTRDAAYSKLILYPGDRLFTGREGRAMLLSSDRTTLSLGPGTIWGLVREGDRRLGFSLWQGLMHLLHRDQPGFFRFETPSMFAGARGTEFVLEVEPDGTSRLAVLDGEVEVSGRSSGVQALPRTLPRGTALPGL